MHPESIEGRCNARTRAGGYCKNPPVTGKRRCRMHGAFAGRKPVTGRYSKVLRTELRKKLEAAQADPDYASVAEELALQRALFAQHLEGIQGRTFTVEDTAILMGWASQITQTAERASRIDARTAITGREIMLLETTIIGLLQEMLSDTEALEFSRRLAARLGIGAMPALVEGEASEVWGSAL